MIYISYFLLQLITYPKQLPQVMYLFKSTSKLKWFTSYPHANVNVDSPKANYEKSNNIHIFIWIQYNGDPFRITFEK